VEGGGREEEEEESPRAFLRSRHSRSTSSARRAADKKLYLPIGSKLS